MLDSIKKEITVKDDLDKKFKEWTNSFSGCTGGRLHKKGGVWICGIEPGGETKNLKEQILEEDHVEPPKVNGFEEVKKWSKNSSLRKGIEGLLKKIFKDKDDFLNARLVLFNLFPIAFRSTDPNLWTKNMYKITGLPTKEDYTSLCRLYRFQRFNELRKKYAPKVIICSGVGRRSDYLLAFFGRKNFYSLKKRLKEASLKKSRFFYLVFEGSHFVCTPFLGDRRSIKEKDEKKIAQKIETMYLK